MRDHPERSSRSPANNKRLVLILGGARSGKSAYAEQLARRMARGRTPVYLATARADDDEMRKRIAAHRRERGDGWQTIEAPADPAAALAANRSLDEPGVVLLDCLTLLVSNLVLDTLPEDIPADADHLDAEAVAAIERRVNESITDSLAMYQRGARSLILVSNEVGMGLVPPYPLGRVYRDVLGRVNARVAAEADVVLLMLAGLPVEIKTLAAAWNATAADLLALDE